MATVVSSDQEHDADVLALIGGSTSLVLSDIPFPEPVAGVRVGRVDGQFVVMPTFAQLDESDMDIVVAGTATDIIMVEGGCREVPEADMIAALDFAMQHIRKIVAAQNELVRARGQAEAPGRSTKVDVVGPRARAARRTTPSASRRRSASPARRAARRSSTSSPPRRRQGAGREVRRQGRLHRQDPPRRRARPAARHDPRRGRARRTAASSTRSARSRSRSACCRARTARACSRAARRRRWS